MIEKFSDYEGTKYLSEEGTFTFEVVSAELATSKAGNDMVVLEVKCDVGTTTIRHSLNPKARWSYNALIAACLNLMPEQKATFELDYQTIHNNLIGKKFIGLVEAESYEKEIKKPNDDGTFTTTVEDRVSYKIVQYEPVV